MFIDCGYRLNSERNFSSARISRLNIEIIGLFFIAALDCAKTSLLAFAKFLQPYLFHIPISLHKYRKCILVQLYKKTELVFLWLVLNGETNSSSLQLSQILNLDV